MAGETIRIGASYMTPIKPITSRWDEIEKKTQLHFELVNYRHNLVNRIEIIDHLGQDIDVLPSVYDEAFLARHHVQAVFLDDLPLIILAPVRHKLMYQDDVTFDDLEGRRILMVKKGRYEAMDHLREDLLAKFPSITINDFASFNMDIFQQCERSGDLLIAFDYMEHIYPLLKRIPIDWDYTYHFGILYSATPSSQVKKLVESLT